MRAKDQRTVRSHPISVCSRRIKKLMQQHHRLMASLLVLALLGASLPLTAQTTHGRKGFQQAPNQSPSRFSHMLAGIVATVNDWFSPHNVSESTAGGVYYPVANFISAPPPVSAPTGLVVTATASAGVTLSWTAPQGTVDQYRIERSENLNEPFVPVADVSGTTYVDPSVLNLHAYLYRVRAISGGIYSSPSNLVLATAISFEFNELENQSIRARHVYDVRTAVNAVREVANLDPVTWARGTLEGLTVKADDVLEMRTALDQALTALNLSVTPYEDSALTAGMFIKATHLEQLQTRSTRGSSNSFGPLDSDLSTARLDPLNETGGGGENPLSRNFNWNLTLAGLPGRAGLDLSIPLSYNSLVWTRTGNFVSFDDDLGFPAPGFRLGFPVIHPVYYNNEVGKYAYLLIGSDGSRTELRQVGSSVFFESADSAHILLDTSLTLPAPDNDKFILRTTDGTRWLYAWRGDAYQCTQIKDRNGNFLTIGYTPAGRIATITDTLNRIITFNYDTNGRLTSITQPWTVDGQNVTHTWATFAYANLPLQTNFDNLTPELPNGSIVNVLTNVTLDDGSRFNFEYTSWGQVWKIKNYAADNHLLNYRSYKLPLDNSMAHTDCPRFTERRDWAENFNRSGPAGASGLPAGAEQEVVTTFAVPVSDSWTMPDSSAASGVRAQITAPDGTSNKIYFISARPVTKCPKGKICLPGTSTPLGWHRGLAALVNSYDSSGVLRRQVMTTWRQDNETVSYQLNPRVEETNVYDPAGNRRRTRISYESVTLPNGMSCALPQDVFEYQADAATLLRRTHTDYNNEIPYTSRRILGLAREKTLHEWDAGQSVERLMSKVTFQYDETGSIQGNDAPVQHDGTGFSSSFVTGRANISSVKRYDVKNLALFTTTSNKYNTAGSVVSIKDAADHETTVIYADAFAANGSTLDAARPFITLGYPTTVNDPDGFSQRTRYHYDFGASTWKQTPLPNVTTNTPGPEETITYDSVGRVKQITSLVNNAFARFTYSSSNNRIDTYVAIGEVDNQIQEAHSFSISDGLGRKFATASAHPGSTGGFAGQLTLFDAMGRPVKTSNPTETDAAGLPINWQPRGDDSAWHYTHQTYDWIGRALRRTHPDGAYTEASYSNCGCAGGEVTTVTDEGTQIGGGTRRRQRKIYADVIGRTWKTEVLNWDGSGPDGTGPNNTVYATTVTTFNARDQRTEIRQYAGPDTGSTFQTTTMSYDGYGRLETQHLPEQQADPNISASTDHTTWTYNADDTINSITDARGAVTTLGYLGTNRHLVKSVTHTMSGRPTINTTFNYDAVGNRTLMTDALGTVDYTYDSLSQLRSETRQFTGTGAPSGNFTLAYEYTLSGVVRKVTDERALTSFSTKFDDAGRVLSVTAVGHGGANTTFVSDAAYRAWDAPKSIAYGNGITQHVSYDSRLRMSAFTVAGFRMSWVIDPPVAPFSIEQNFEYYADGRLKFATRQNPSGILGDLRTHNRAFEYDHVGRLREAYSGGEAHEFLGDLNSGIGQGPYRLSFTYDPWNNILSGGGRYWSRGNTSVAAYNNHDRNPDWAYDPDGRLISRNEPPSFPTEQPHRVTHDAAGQPSVATQARAYFEPIRQQMVTATLTNSQGYDGDGNLIRYSKERTDASLNQVTHGLEVTFHLRSSVLGGVGVSEYDGTGVWQRSHVFAGAEVVGELTKTFNGSEARSIFRHRNHLMSDELDSASNGDFGGESVIDPQGVNVAGSDPFPPDGSGDADGSVTPDPDVPASRGDGLVMAFGESGMRCVLDGMAVDCAFVGRSAVQCPENDCGPRTRALVDRDGNHMGYILTNPFQAFADGHSGFIPVGMRYVGDAIILGSIWTGGASERITPDDFAVGTAVQAASGHFRNPHPEDEEEGEKRIRRLIRRPEDDLPSAFPFQRRAGASGIRPGGSQTPVARDRVADLEKEAKANEIASIRTRLLNDCINREYRQFANEAMQIAGPRQYLQARLAGITSRPTWDDLGPAIFEMAMKGKLNLWVIPATMAWREFKAHAGNFTGVLDAHTRYQQRKQDCLKTNFNPEAEAIYHRRR